MILCARSMDKIDYACTYDILFKWMHRNENIGSINNP